MLLKSFFFNLYLLIQNFSFYLAIFLTLISFLFLFTDLRKKFILFILIIVGFSVWGFLLDLDGIILVFLTAEFTIFLLFLMTYLQLYSNFQFISVVSRVNFIYFAFILFLYYVPQNSFYFFSSFYKSIWHIVSSDFYILYYFLFEKLPALVILLTLIISFFSLFFIIMYFNLKLSKLNSNKTLKTLYFLRKQNLTKQTNFNTKVYTFQN